MSVDCLVVYGGDARFDVAADFYQRGLANRILLCPEEPDRLVREGVVPPKHELDRAALVERGVPADAIKVLSGAAASFWDTADALNDELQRGSFQSAAILCERFESRAVSQIVDYTVHASHASHIAVYALEDRRFEDHTWWTTKSGVRSFVICGLGYLHTIFYGRPVSHGPTWDAQEYERSLR